VRPDLFLGRKTVKVKLTKEVHSAFRGKVIERGMSMQEVFDELARLVAIGDHRLDVVLKEHAKRKVKLEYERLLNPKPRRQDHIGELDHESLYDMINTGDK
jgi:hypothetical protein